MKRLLCIPILSALLLLPILATAAPVDGIYRSTDFPSPLTGLLLTGRASTWRPGINSGLPHVLHAQSWDETTLGTQWQISCAVENSAFSIQDYRVNGTGTVIYTSTFQGGTFTFFPGGWPWGDGTGTLGTTNLITTVSFVGGYPMGGVVNGTTSGAFEGGCELTFAIANGLGAGETTDLYPTLTKPADYPEFLDGTCGPASPTLQYGSWGTVLTITMGINCPVPTEETTWGNMKALYR
jgi:hypothetical protein